jgi:hypothetical protein
VNRRLFLQGVGGAFLAAPILSSLQGSSASAQNAGAAKRLVIFYTQNGCITNRWFPTVENGALTPEALAGTTLAPLSDVSHKLLFPRGLGMFPRGQINGYFDPHDQGMGTKLTCAPIDPAGEHWSTGRSLDHVAAELVNPGTKTPLVLSVGFTFSNVKGIVSYSAPNEPYAPETKATNVYKNLTGLFNAGTTAGAPMTEADYRVKQGKSIIDLVRADLDTFKRLKMSTADTKKVDDWLSLLRETEIPVVSAACNADLAAQLEITDAAVTESSGGVRGGGGGDNGTAFTKGGDMMLKLIALTMMCDANRVIIMQWPGFVTFKWDGLDHQFDHHGLSHRNGSAEVGGTCVDGVIDRLHEIDTWYAGRYSKLVHLIDSIQEGEGVSMLDNSMVMWLPELADGNAHNNNNLPIVIAGGAGGYLKQGQSVSLDTKTLGTGDSEASCAGGEIGFGSVSRGGDVPINKLYVTLLNALGATNAGQPITEFGLADSNDVTAGITKPGELDALKA